MRKTNFAPGNIYHVYNRGNDGRSIFNEERDRWRFLQGLGLFNNEKFSHQILWNLENRGQGANMKTLKNFLDEKRESNEPLVKIMTDCLMPNHFHLILEEVKERGISNFMHKLGTGYTSFFNKKYGKSGGLFQGRFKARHIDNDLYLQYLLVYINIINPGQLIEPGLKEDGIKDIGAIMKFAAKYKWSTNPEYLQTRNSFIIDKGILGEIFSDPEEYKSFAEMVLREKKYKEIDDLFLE